MNDINLTRMFHQKMTNRSRVRGRYNSSELYFINKGQLTPEQWMHARPRSTKELLAMWNGTGMHAQLESIVGKDQSEIKKEIFYNGITLVGKADFLPNAKPDEVWEFKTSEKKMTKSKPWHDHQVKLYCSMFSRANGIVYQPLSDDNGLYLKHIGTVERDDVWFEEELRKLYEFHLKVEQLWKGNI